MKVTLAAIGRLKAGPERELFDHYAKLAGAVAPSARISGFAVREFNEGRARNVDERRAEEAKLLREAAGKGAWLCALDERGANLTSAGWAAEIARARDSGVPSYAVVLGGPDGLDETIRAAARTTVAFGALTWPHQLARVMAAEQVYRCFTILCGHPYHRA